MFDDLQLGDASPVTYNYLSDNFVAGGAFTDSCPPVTLNATVSISSPQPGNHACGTMASNTFNNDVVLRTDKSWQLLRVLSIQGREMLVKTGVNTDYIIPGDLLSPGVYIYQLFGSDGEVCTRKFLVK